MSIRKLLIVLGLCGLFAGCSTGKYYGDNSLAYSDSSYKSMGVRYLLGRGVKQSDEKAFYYFSQAANQGDALAQNKLAYMYAAGQGTPKNNTQAFRWYKAAAEQGLASAQYNLALMYMHGLGTAANKAKANEWLQKSASLGFQPARDALQDVRS